MGPKATLAIPAVLVALGLARSILHERGAASAHVIALSGPTAHTETGRDRAAHLAGKIAKCTTELKGLAHQQDDTYHRKRA